MIQSLSDPKKTTVYELPYDETFMSFVDFTHFAQIGFEDRNKENNAKLNEAAKDDKRIAFEEEAVRLAFLIRKD